VVAERAAQGSGLSQAQAREALARSQGEQLRGAQGTVGRTAVHRVPAQSAGVGEPISIISGNSAIIFMMVLLSVTLDFGGRPWASRPSPALAAASAAVVAIALLLPFTWLGTAMEFDRPPVVFFVWLAGMLLAYLALVEYVKRCFLHHVTDGAER
jgi:hypothetical protein